MSVINVSKSSGTINNLSVLGSLSSASVNISSQTYNGAFPGITNPVMLQNTQTCNDTVSASGSYLDTPVSMNVIGSTTFNSSNTNIQYNQPCTLFLDSPIAGTNMAFPSGGFSLITKSGMYVHGNSVFAGNIDLNYKDLTSAYSITIVGGPVSLKIPGSTSSAATAGAAVLPSAPAGFVNILLGGVLYKMPYYPS